MIQDARSLPAGAVIDADVAIIGGGAAGISLALLQQQSRRIEAARQALDLRKNQIETVDAAVEHRATRLKDLDVMLQRGSVNSPYYEPTQADYLETLSRKQEIEFAIQQSQTQIDDAQSNLAKLKLDARFALQHELSGLALQIAQQTIAYQSHLASLNVIDAYPNIPPAHLDYEVVRRSSARVATYHVMGAHSAARAGTQAARREASIVARDFTCKHWRDSIANLAERGVHRSRKGQASSRARKCRRGLESTDRTPKARIRLLSALNWDNIVYEMTEGMALTAFEASRSCRCMPAAAGRPHEGVYVGKGKSLAEVVAN